MWGDRVAGIFDAEQNKERRRRKMYVSLLLVTFSIIISYLHFSLRVCVTETEMDIY